jgi:Domain of unknown function (DUF6378)
MSPRQILEHAAEVLDDRATTYGPVATSVQRIAARWSLTLGRPVTPAEVVLCLIDLKIARLQHDPAHRDSITDVIGYAALLPEVSA